ncbi:hypothetical protein R3W88_013923 [Solanum pinnatisectum]|uniref:Uncharacterized protein n=1 Tax=Solanum pinnatisectum TaxID=50273 RepID=A0AAV9KQ41_9SOLN|nr:hypothetical protein R3W88_013923 [Solanum pinnatisectum]
MNEQTSSTRFTPGILTHPKKLDDCSSFSLGLIQDFQEIAGSLAKYRFNQQNRDYKKSMILDLKPKETKIVSTSNISKSSKEEHI